MDELVPFVRGHIPSVWALELLLLLRAHPERYWPPAVLVRELRASDKLVRENLARFQKAGLVVEETEGWRFAPATPWLEFLTEKLAAMYRERPVATMNLISRPDPLQSLADAFKLKGDGK